MINVQRVYEPVKSGCGRRWLVDRIWPRGLTKASAALDGGWARDCAPTDALRRWYADDPSRYDEFRSRYLEELRARPEVLDRLVNAARVGNIVLVYAGQNEESSNAHVLREYLEERLKALLEASGAKTRAVEAPGFLRIPSRAKS